MFSCHSVPGGAEPMTLPSWWLTHITTVDLAACEAPFYYFRCCNTLQPLQSLEMLWLFGSISHHARRHYFQRLLGAAVLLKGSKGGCEINTVIKGQGVEWTEGLCGIVSSLSAGNWRCHRALVSVPKRSGSASAVGLGEVQVDGVWLEAKISVLGTDQPGFFVNVFPCTLIILKKTLAANSRICL